MKTNDTNDEQIKALLDTNPEAGFKMLIDEYGSLAKGMCRNIMYGLSDADIDEAVADCFISFWKSMHKIKNVKYIKSYLVGIIKNCAADKMKSAIKLKNRISYDNLDLGIDVDMETEVSASINAKIVKETVMNMPNFEREIFIRRYFYYQKVKFIAENMNCEPKKVENILYRYKGKLRDELLKRGIVL